MTARSEEHSSSEPGDIEATNAEISSLKHIGLVDAIALVIGVLVGSGIFSTPGIIAANAGSIGASLSVWIVAGVLTLISAQCYAELGAALPSSGGPVVYLSEMYGPFMSFLYSWSTITALRPASMAMHSFICSKYACRAFYYIFIGRPDEKDVASLDAVPEYVIKLVAAAVVCTVSIINTFSIRSGPHTTLVLSSMKILALLTIIILGLVVYSSGRQDPGFTAPSLWDGSTKAPGQYVVALIGAMYAYEGIAVPGEVAGEFKKPKRDLPLSLSVGIVLVMVLYTSVNTAYFAVLPKALIQKTETVALDFGFAVLGPAGGILFTLVVAMSSFGALNIVVLTGSRVISATASNGFLPSKLADLDKETSTPFNAIMFQLVLCLVMILIGNFRFLLVMGGIMGMTLMLATVIGMFFLAKQQPDLKRPYKAPVASPYVCIVTIAYQLVMAFYEKPIEALLAFTFMAAAYPAYLIATSLRPDEGHSSRGTFAAVIARFKRAVGAERDSSVEYQVVDNSEREDSFPSESNNVAIETIEMQRK